MARNVVIESYCYACMAFIIKASNVSLAKGKTLIYVFWSMTITLDLK